MYEEAFSVTTFHIQDWQLTIILDNTKGILSIQHQYIINKHSYNQETIQ